MNDDHGFFSDVFDDPGDDPLLGGEGASAESAETPEHQGPPSWMSEEKRTNGEADARSEKGGTEAGRKQIVVDQRGNEAEGIEALNRAVEQGWRLVGISRDRPDGEQATEKRRIHRFVATLEQERPQSLFDFDSAS